MIRLRRIFGLLLLGLLFGGCMSRTERLFQRAELFLSQGQPALAANEYYHLATKYPRSLFAPNALYKLAYLYREEFDDPPRAIATYRALAERYPASPYADEAWMWILRLQGKMKDLTGMRETRDQICRRFAGDDRLGAMAQLEYARALLAAGQVEAAEAEARQLLAAYPRQERSCAAAWLIIARVLEKRAGENTDQAVRAYEQIINKYPQTPSAVEAKRAIGWLYYGIRGRQQKAEKQAKARAARMLSHLSPVPAANSPRLRPFACLSSLLRARNVSTTPEMLFALSGAGFEFSFVPEQPEAGRWALPRNALSDAAEAFGFSVNVSAIASPEASFATLIGALAAGQPSMIPIVGGREWLIVAGYIPADDRVYVWRPGTRRQQALSRAELLARWARQTLPELRCITGPFFQLSLSTQSGQPSAAALAKRMGRYAAEQQEAVARSYAALQNCLAPEERGAAPAGPAWLRAWAGDRLPEILAERQALADSLEALAAKATEGGESLRKAAQAYHEAVGLGRQLREALLALTASKPALSLPLEQAWTEAATLANQMHEAETRALGALANLAR